MKKNFLNLFSDLKVFNYSKLIIVLLFILIFILGKISFAQILAMTPTTILATKINIEIIPTETNKTDNIPLQNIENESPKKDTPQTPKPNENKSPEKNIDNDNNDNKNKNNLTPNNKPEFIKPIQIPNQENQENQESPEVQEIINTFETMQNIVQDTKKKVIEIIEQNIQIPTTSPNENNEKIEIQSTSSIESMKKEIIHKINTTLTETNITPKKINELNKNIKNDLNKINNAVQNDYSQTIEEIFKTISLTIEEQVKILKEQGGDLIYKDSNKDGISDYDSIHIYNIDPIKPTPITLYNDKEITAGEKILLGFDPKETTLVKINQEEPEASAIKPTAFYKIEDVKLTSDKKINITGKFLPNNFVTIYIYSTPIIVTVKTNINGEWKYTLDEELENGKHTIYVATVNNTGKILAKSTAFTFIKTAEAATLEKLPFAQTTENIKPSFLSKNNIYIFAGLFIIIILSVLIIVGNSNKKLI
ncbi:MAG: Ig-like domain-containing protein [bacterium]